MSAKLILGLLAVLFVGTVLWDRWRRGGGPLTIQQRTWLIVAGIFAVVSGYLTLLA